MKRVLIILLVSTMIITGCVTQTQITTAPPNQTETVVKAAYIKISAQEAKVIMDTEENVIIVDVRTPEEYAQGHIPDAILMPVAQIRSLAPELLPDLDQTILVYCRSGNRSETGAKTLIDMGYSKVFDFGGIQDWPFDIVK
ncbi:MAG TPA: rhodanese-like domain-containing protein [Clostridiales bacterium]|nr:rhodanese-like domain-containing protein [Clostridiales bacterium]